MFKEDEKRYSRVSPREIAAEVGCDYVLPDYLGDVRKILFTEARCLPLPTYMSGDELSTSGAVEFRMIYTDSEGLLSSVSFTRPRLRYSPRARFRAFRCGFSGRGRYLRRREW